MSSASSNLIVLLCPEGDVLFEGVSVLGGAQLEEREIDTYEDEECPPTLRSATSSGIFPSVQKQAASPDTDVYAESPAA